MSDHLVSKDFCEKCQECNRDQFETIIGMVTDKFSSQTKLFQQKIKDMEYLFIACGGVFTFVIAFTDWMSKVIPH